MHGAVADTGAATLGTVSLWTPSGRGAVATLRLQVPLSFWRDCELFQPQHPRASADWPLNRIVYGRWGATASEDVVIARIADVTWELHCHGGLAAVQRIQHDLATAGLRVLPWTEQLAASGGRLAAAWHQALSHTITTRTTQLVLKQTPERWNRTLRAWEAAVIAGDWESVLSAVSAGLGWKEFGRHLTQPWRVVLTGRPNVGKSALLNALVGYERAVVCEQPGTTRDLVTSPFVCDGWPLELCDTAGVREAESELEAAGIELARSELETADLTLLVLDRSQHLSPADELRLQEVLGNTAVIVIANKSDLPAAWHASGVPGIVEVSATTAEGLNRLQQQISQRVITTLPDSNQLVPVSESHLVCLRELQTAILERDLSSFQQVVRHWAETAN